MSHNLVHWFILARLPRSTGASVIYLFGSLVGGASFVSNPVALSSAESEYNASAFAITAAIHTKQVYNSIMGHCPDTPLTFHTFVYSTSAIAMMNSDKVTRKAQHIERCIHFVQQARAQGVFIPHKVPGERNPADVGTKNLNGAIIVNHSQEWNKDVKCLEEWSSVVEYYTPQVSHLFQSFGSLELVN